MLFLFFSKFCASKSGVRLIYGCGLYTDVYGSSFKPSICSLFDRLNSNWHGTSMPQHSCLQYRLRLITSYKKIPCYSAELARQMADRSMALYHFPDVFVHGVVKLWFSNKCFSDRGLPCASINMMGSKVRTSSKSSIYYIILHKELSEHGYLEAYMAFSHEGYTNMIS